MLQGVNRSRCGLQVLGDKQSKSEDVLGYEGGYRGLLGKRISLDFSIFRNHYTRLQSFGPTTLSHAGSNTVLSIQYTNQIHGDTYELEFAPQVAIANSWHMNFAYSYLNSSFKADGPTSDISSSGSVNTYENSSPRHQVVLHSLVDLPWKLEFDQLYQYVGALPAQKVLAYQTMDVQLGRRSEAMSESRQSARTCSKPTTMNGAPAIRHSQSWAFAAPRTFI